MDYLLTVSGVTTVFPSEMTPDPAIEAVAVTTWIDLPDPSLDWPSVSRFRQVSATSLAPFEKCADRDPSE